MVTNDPDSNLSDGLSLVKTKLVGQPANTLIDENSCNLDKFTFNFYIKINSLPEMPAAGAAAIKYSILKVGVGSPNKLEIELVIDNTGYKLVTTLDEGTGVGITPARTAVKYSRTIDTTTAAAKDKLTSDDVFISCVFNKDGGSKKYIYFINNVEAETYNNAPTNRLTLESSEVTINGGTTALDAKLYSFMFFNTDISLDDHKNILTYIRNQRSGLDPFINKINSLTTSELAKINSLLSAKNLSIAALNTQLEQCRTLEDDFNKVAMEKERDKWSVRIDGENIQLSPEDLKKCSILKVKST